VIYISQDLDLALIEVKRDLLNYTIVDSRDREFLVEHANEAIKRAYITTSTPETIILVAPKFSIIAQNKLLKVLEEPPFNKEFILITKSKSSLLPTIKSRLPVINLSKKSSIKENIELDLENLGEEEIYNFLKQRQKISKLEVKNILEIFF
jgi:DNA polymerase-3 subunit delta'